MERIQTVDILQIGCRRLIGDIQRMLQRNVPYREGLKLGVAGLDATLVLMVQLAQTGSKLAAAGAGSRHDDDRTGRLNIGIGTIALVTNDQVNICRISGSRVVGIGADSAAFQLCHELFCGRLSVITGYDNAVDQKTVIGQILNQAEGFGAIGDAVIAAQLIALDIPRVYTDDDLSLILQLLQQTHLDVLIIAG